MTDDRQEGDGATKDGSFDQLSQPGPLLRRCHQRSREIYARVLGDEAPTRHQLAVMLAIHQLKNPTQAAITARTGIDRNTVADMVRRLIARGHVRRVPHAADARAVELRLTEAGEKIVIQSTPKVLEVQSEILAPLPDYLKSEFQRCLRLIAGIDSAPDR